METKQAIAPENNPTMVSAAYGGLSVVRLAPGDQQLTADYTLSAEAERVRATVLTLDTPPRVVLAVEQPAAAAGSFTLAPLWNRTDYRLRMTALKNGQEIAVSANRLFRTGPIPGVVVNYIHPEDYTFNSSGRSPASPSILRLSNGSLLVSHDIFWGGGGQNLTHLYRSDDGGVSWYFVSELYPCFWASLFTSKGVLYAMGTSCEYGALNLF
ncbi:MAG: sialidase family protein, partial [Angelakisella sp.]